MNKRFDRIDVLLSRIGGLCLLLLGVHSAGDFINRGVFSLLDSLDLAIDHAGWTFLKKIGSLSLISPAKADTAAETLASWIEISEKEYLAGFIGLAIEIACIAFLADFTWGHRPAPVVTPPQPPPPSFKKQGYRPIFTAQPEPLEPEPEPEPEPSHFRFEPLAVSSTLAMFTMSGLCFLAVAVENVLFKIFEPYPSVNRYMVPAGATLGIALGLVCLARFLPGMLVGAYRHSIIRILWALKHPPAQAIKPTHPILAALPRYVICDTRRGILVALLLMPLALYSLFASIQLNASAIWVSLGAMP